MDNSWVKLYRKLLDNEVMQDAIALQVFIWVLIHVDKKTGIYRTGRKRGALALNLPETTFRDALYRLRDKYQIVATTNAGRFTEISLLKWAEYQSTTKVTPDLTPNGRQIDATITRIENKNNTSYIMLTKNQLEKLKKDFPYLDIDYEVERFRAWQKGTGKEFPNVLERLRAWLLQQKHENKKDTNVILEDPIFKQLQVVWRFNEGVGFIRKSDLQSRIGNKYPTYKFQREWEEAKKVLNESTTN